MMKKLSKIALLAAASAFMLAVFPACGDDDGDGETKDPVPSVKITGGTSVTVGGAALELTASVSDFPEGVTYEWTSLAEDKATVEKKSDDPSKATVTAVAEGTAKIKVTAKSGDTEKSAEITVTVAPEGGLGPVTPPSSSGAVTAIWDFDKGVNASKNATILGFNKTTTALSANEKITPDSGSGATFTVLANNNNKIKYGANTNASEGNLTGGGIQQNTGTQERDFGEIKVDAACTVTIVAMGASGSLSGNNINSFSINGTNQFKVDAASGPDQDAKTYTYTASTAETIKITATGMKFMSITCS